MLRIDKGSRAVSHVLTIAAELYQAQQQSIHQIHKHTHSVGYPSRRRQLVLRRRQGQRPHGDVVMEPATSVTSQIATIS